MAGLKGAFSRSAVVIGLAIVCGALIIGSALRTPSAHTQAVIESIHRRRQLRHQYAAAEGTGMPDVPSTREWESRCSAKGGTVTPGGCRQTTSKSESAASLNEVASAADERNARLLTRDDVLARVPVGGLAFFTLANDAYADLAVNWALLLRPVLATVGAAEHYFIGALDKNLTATLLSHRLPTLRLGMSGAHDGAQDAPSGNFRLQFAQFRAYGVTKADLLVCLMTI